MQITNKQIIAYCKRENKMQNRVYPRKIQIKAMSREKANLYFLIIKNLGALAEDMQEANLTWDQLREAVAKQKGKRKTEQLNLFK
jgi:hypothetical protein